MKGNPANYEDVNFLRHAARAVKGGAWLEKMARLKMKMVIIGKTRGVGRAVDGGRGSKGCWSDSHAVCKDVFLGAICLYVSAEDYRLFV